MYVITPHGGAFAEAVEVRIPAPALTLEPNQEFKLAKAEPGEERVVLDDTELDAGVLSVRVDSFSFFTPVVGASSYPKVSDDGHVLFATNAPNLTGNLASALRQALVVRDLQSSAISVASRTPAGASVWTASGVYNNHALSGDGMVLALVADGSDMTGGIPDHQVYVAPRP